MKAYKDKTGSWYIQYRYKTLEGEVKKSCKRGFKTKREAEEWYHEFLLKQSQSCNMLFSTFVDIYLKDMAPRLKLHTMINKEYVIKDKLLPVFGARRMDEISVANIREWQTSLMAKGYSQTYLRSINNQLSAIFNHAKRFYSMPVNPSEQAGKMGKANAKEMYFWTQDEFLKFIATMKSKPTS